MRAWLIFRAGRVYLHLSHFEMKIQIASILYTCFKRWRRCFSCIIWNFTPVPIRQNEHQTAKRYAARQGDFRRNVFDVSSSAADNITHGDLLDCAWLRLTPVTQYMQMWDRHRFKCSDYPRTRSLIKTAACGKHWLEVHVFQWPVSLRDFFFFLSKPVSDYPVRCIVWCSAF